MTPSREGQFHAISLKSIAETKRLQEHINRQRQNIVRSENWAVYAQPNLLKSRSAALLYNPRSLVVLLTVEDSENGEEQVDDIEVEADGSCNFLLNVVVPHNELSIHKNISGED